MTFIILWVVFSLLFAWGAERIERWWRTRQAIKRRLRRYTK